MRDEDVDFSDIPEIPLEKFVRGIVRKGLKPVARGKNEGRRSADFSGGAGGTPAVPGKA